MINMHSNPHSLQTSYDTWWCCSCLTVHLNASDHEHVGKHLVTCADCILWTDTKVSTGDGRNGRNIYIFSEFRAAWYVSHLKIELPKTHLTTFHCPAAKTGKLDLPDMEVFKKQAACLNFPPEFHFGESTGEMLIHRCTNHTKEHRSCNLFRCLSTRFPPPVFRSVSLREGGCDSCVGGRTIEIWSYSLT